MRHLNRTTFCVAALLCLLGCGCKEQPRQAAPAAQAGGSLLDWQRWNVAARAFKPAAGKSGGRMVVTSFGAGTKTFNPITSTETSSMELLQFVFDGLTTLDPATQEIKPCLARSWTVSEDLLTYEFLLRDDVKWSDGAPLTADDVVFTFEVIFDARNTANARDILMVKGKPVKVEKTGPLSVRFTLPVPFTPLLKALVGTTTPVIPRHKLANAQKKGIFATTWEKDTKLSEIVGTGPFIIASYAASEQCVLRRNENYWKQDAAGTRLPYLDTLVFTYVRDRNVEVLKFQNNESDYLEMRGQDYPLLKPLERQGNFTIYNLGPQFGELYLMFNQNPGMSKESGKPYVEPARLKWFRTREFRQAVAYCIDKTQMINIVNNGLAAPIIGPMNEAQGYFFNAAMRSYPYHLDTARAILAKAGFRDVNADSVLEDPEGNPVEFTIHTNSDNTDRARYAEIIRKDLGRVGIKVHVVAAEFNNIIDKFTSTYDWEAIILGFTGTEEPHDGANVWLSGARSHMWYPEQPAPSTPWEARIDEIFSQGAMEPDRAKRKALYDEWQAIFGEQVPYIELVTPLRLIAVRNRFGNVDPAPYAEGMYFQKRKFFHNIEEININE